MASLELREAAVGQSTASSGQICHLIESGHLTDLATNPVSSTKDFRAVPTQYRTLIRGQIKDSVSLNQSAT